MQILQEQISVTAQPHHLQWPLDHVDSLSGNLKVINASSPPTYASYVVLVHQLAASPEAPTVGAPGFLQTAPRGLALAIR
jgi:hypothetical protein